MPGWKMDVDMATLAGATVSGIGEVCREDTAIAGAGAVGRVAAETGGASCAMAWPEKHAQAANVTDIAKADMAARIETQLSSNRLDAGNSGLARWPALCFRTLPEPV